MHPKLLEPEIQEKIILFYTYVLNEQLYCLYDFDYQIYDDNHNPLDEEKTSIMIEIINKYYNTDEFKVYNTDNPLVYHTNHRATINIFIRRYSMVYLTYTRRLYELIEN